MTAHEAYMIWSELRAVACELHTATTWLMVLAIVVAAYTAVSGGLWALSFWRAEQWRRKRP